MVAAEVGHDPRAAASRSCRYRAEGCFCRRRRILYHLIADASQARDERRNGYARIDQRFPALAFHSFLVTDKRNLDNAVMQGRATRGFQVQDDVGKREQGYSSGERS